MPQGTGDVSFGIEDIHAKLTNVRVSTFAALPDGFAVLFKDTTDTASKQVVRKASMRTILARYKAQRVEGFTGSVAGAIRVETKAIVSRRSSW